MLDFFKSQKEKISLFLEGFLNSKLTNFSKINFLGNDVTDRILHFIKNGKMIRGGLVALSYSLFKDDAPEEITKAGAVLELLQSALLIHDDIMDRDIKRRGEDTIFHQYSKYAEVKNIDEHKHVGEALGICAGDITFFLAYELISSLNLNPEVKQKVFKLSAEEMSYVGIAQMADVFSGAVKDFSDENSIITLYKYKTGRYTFSLPLMIGAAIAGVEDKVIHKLCSIGENLGIIFQIKDDEIGMFGTEESIGKPVGSDLKEGKKTLMLYLLMNKVSDSDKEKILKIVGNKNISEREIGYIRGLLEKYNILNELNLIIENLNKEVRNEITALDVNSNSLKILFQLIDYNLNRKY